tara:strand:+ start:1349 stop:2482 length:1134 start_codon:yes stop_codon:yes gene_type:complete
MKLFKSLLVAPATLGLLAPMTATASEVNFNAISNYSDETIGIDIKSFTPSSNDTLLLSGGEGLVDTDDHDGGFSDTTTASFSLDTVIGAVDGGNDSTEALSFDYQMNIGLSTSFTGEDSLDVTIDIGNSTTSSTTHSAAIMGFQATGNAMDVDGITYTFPLGGATVVVGDTTDISSTFTGACAYSAFTDYMGNCGTGNSVGVGGKGVTASIGYAFDSGFSLAGGVSSTETQIMTKEGTDMYGIEAAYTADTYGVAVAYTSDDKAGSAETTYWGVNGYYTFDLASLSVGYETEETNGTDKSGYFVGLTFPEVGPGSVSVGLGTQTNYADSEEELLTYEASYSYAINDGMTVTPGVYISEASGTADDDTGVLVKTSFSF